MFHATIRLALSNIAALQKALRARYPSVRSSHADEALAASLGFKSYAAMLAVLREAGDSARLVVQTDVCLLQVRLEQLGYHGLRTKELQRLIWEAPYPTPWQGDEVEQSLRKRFAPMAANSQ